MQDSEDSDVSIHSEHKTPPTGSTLSNMPLQCLPLPPTYSVDGDTPRPPAKEDTRREYDNVMENASENQSNVVREIDDVINNSSNHDLHVAMCTVTSVVGSVRDGEVEEAEEEEKEEEN